MSCSGKIVQEKLENIRLNRTLEIGKRSIEVPADESIPHLSRLLQASLSAA